MVETNSVRGEKPKLSAKDRLCLIQTINALPLTQFDELVFALDPPKGVVASSTAPQGTRSKDLLDWLEGSTGPGLAAADEVLQILIPKATWTAPQPVAFVISGKISSSTAAELQAFVELLRKKTGDYSIDIAFFQEGSIKVILNGSPEGLTKLQEMFEAGELEQLITPPVEALASVDINTQEARKARLIQTLRLSCGRANRARALARALDTARVHDTALDTALDIARDIANTLARDLDTARDLDFNLVSYRALTNAIANANALALALDFNLVGHLDRALTLALDLSNADLSGASLRNLNLVGANLADADFTNGDFAGTKFGNNLGLSDTDKRDLQSRGAIFLDPPSSYVPALVLR
ncbi:pentapeptide repeat-containing protein [Leptolyngbya sp. CCNP1308]|uniref:pentapeptide repeat-containing protein n=1 Tax=Leptolyngbya sp. CCNP1308 TaxID=3110255 RepID=UPI002B20C1B7|nr:pentapeptide repeat-containing protein [Leptolyngbya sp. CCNP1308]MEA5448455.1 pentapeptide repeat-containing protein [Leptolyngbya sp. CCNP1308]